MPDMLYMSGVIASVLSVFAFLPYIKDTLIGRTQPERASWLIWSVLSTISFFSQLHEGASLSLLFSGAQVSATVTIFLLSIKLGYGQYLTDINKKLYAITGLGLITSFLNESAVYALGVSIAISLLGGSKTVIKAYYNPDTETTITWVLALTASVFGLISVGQIDVVLLAYPLYLVVLYSSIIVAILIARRRRTSGRLVEVSPGEIARQQQLSQVPRLAEVRCTKKIADEYRTRN